MTAELLVPVGRCVGAYYPVPGSAQHVQQVLVGAEVVELSDAEFAAWALAHGFPDGAEVWTAGAVLGRLADAAVPDPALLLDAVRARGVLADVSPGTPAAVAFARTHRLLPLVLGLGNAQDEPRLYAAGFYDRPMVAMTRALYDVWEWAHLAPDLWTACEEAALSAREAGSSAHDETDPALLLDGVLRALHVLLAPSVVCVDVAP